MRFLDWRWDGIPSTLTFSLEKKKVLYFQNFEQEFKPSHFTNQNGHHQKKPTMNAREDVDKMEPSCTVGGNVN